jgi:CRP/FNR family transcriptional regulator
MVKLTNVGSQHGIEQILNIAKPGEVIGLDDAISAKFYHYNAETLEESDICLIDKDTFIGLMADNALFLQEILKRAFSSVKNRDEIISRLTQYSVRERTALTLLSLITEHGVRTKTGVKLDLHLTRKEIGQYSGTVQESIIRVLADFKKEGLIDLHKSEITILDQHALTRVFNPRENS